MPYEKPRLRRIEDPAEVESLRARLGLVEPRTGVFLRVVEADFRPKTRGDCLPGGCNEQRPCPWVSCRHHLALTVWPSGRVTEHGDPETMAETCSLDVADRGGVRLEEIGEWYGCSRENVRQIEDGALDAIFKRAPELRDAMPESSGVVEDLPDDNDRDWEAFHRAVAAAMERLGVRKGMPAGNLRSRWRTQDFRRAHNGLTPRQKAIHDAWHDLSAELGRPPMLRELVERSGARGRTPEVAQSNVSGVLAVLRFRGLIGGAK